MTPTYPMAEIPKENKKKFPYKEGDHFEAISHGSSCPVCDAPWHEDSPDGEGFICQNHDHWGAEYEANCDKCGYYAFIEMKAVVVEQKFK